MTSSDHEHKLPFYRKYIFSTDHKVIGIQFFFTGLVMAAIGGALAMLLRYQLAWPWEEVPYVGKMLFEDGYVPAEQYATLFTMHGTVMIFFVIIPVLVGCFGNFLIPLQIGAPDMAFPKLNMLSYWMVVPAILIVLAGFLTEGGGAAAGWTAYPPLSALADAQPQAVGQICWAAGLLILGFSSIIGSVNYLTTIITMRAPGMTMFRMPLTIWSLFITSVLVLLATPVLASALLLLLLDQTAGTSFFIATGTVISEQLVDHAGGGQPLLWQHLFWFYSHPAVYIMILPAMGVVSEVLATFSRKPIFGYRPMIYALGAIAGLGFIVWAHHMFQAGLNPSLGIAFTVSTLLIAVPSAIKIFNWLGTLWGGNIRFTTAMLNALAFVSMFVIGGLSGLFMAMTPVDIHIHDTYFIVGHLHYVLFGGSVFGIFAGVYFWFPKMFGKMLNDGLGKVHFFLTFIFMNMTFFLMHIVGLGGHPRRIATILHPPFDLFDHLQPLNVFMTVGALCLGISQIPLILNIVLSLIGVRAASITRPLCAVLTAGPLLYLLWTLKISVDPEVTPGLAAVIGSEPGPLWRILGTLAVLGSCYPIIRAKEFIFGAPAGDNPWEATTLEWTTSSPPGHGNFETIPVVYHGPYEYSRPGVKEDWVAQTRKLPDEGTTTA